MGVPHKQFWLRSDMFKIDPKEDEETNPFCYGKELAQWIRTRFAALGYTPEEVFPEDWGWCVMLEREPFMLWIGCGNNRSHLLSSITPDQKESYVPIGSELTWTCLVGADALIWTSFYWKQLFGRASTKEAVDRVSGELEQVLRSEPAVQLVEEP